MGTCILRVASLGFFLFVYGFSAFAVETGCSLQTLEGSYVFSARGWSKTDPKGYRPIAYIGLLTYDGKGKVVAKFRNDSAKTTQSVTGTYILNKACEADVTLKNGRKATYFVSPTGDSFSFVVTSGVIASGDGRRITKEALLKDVVTKPKDVIAKPKGNKKSG